MKNNLWPVLLYFILCIVHFGIWRYLELGQEVVFLRYYIFLTMLFLMVVVALSIIKKMYPTYIGFGFLGLVMVKLAALLVAMKFLKLDTVPHYKLHFGAPYLISLVLETLYAVKLIGPDTMPTVQKDEKDQQPE